MTKDMQFFRLRSTAWLLLKSPTLFRIMPGWFRWRAKSLCVLVECPRVFSLRELFLLWSSSSRRPPGRAHRHLQWLNERVRRGMSRERYLDSDNNAKLFGNTLRHSGNYEEL